MSDMAARAPAASAAGAAPDPVSPTLLLVDGHAFAYRAFHAVPAALTDQDGRPVGAVHGFASMLLGLVHQRQPVAVAVAFDEGRDLRRSALYPQYKATRSKMPDELSEQIGRIRQLLDVAGVAQVSLPGVEADDVLATLAVSAPVAWQVEIATGDRDVLQLVNDRVRVLDVSRGVSKLQVMGAEQVKAKYLVDPAQYVQLAALRGDTSDNLAGVPGVGAKTAAALLCRFGSLEQVYSRIHEVTPPRIAALLAQHEEAVLRNVELMSLVTTVPLPQQVRDPDQLRWRPDTDGAATWCRRAGLAQVAGRFAALGRADSPF